MKKKVTKIAEEINTQLKSCMKNQDKYSKSNKK